MSNDLLAQGVSAILNAIATDTTWQRERDRLAALQDPTIDVQTAVFVTTKLQSYTSVTDSWFTPVEKLKKFYTLYAHGGQTQYGPTCLKLIARIERWK